MADDSRIRRIIRGARLFALACATIGMVLLTLGALTVPLAGWGAAYVFAAGLWLLVGAAVPATVFAAAVVIGRSTSGQWYCGDEDSDAD